MLDFSDLTRTRVSTLISATDTSLAFSFSCKAFMIQVSMNSTFLGLTASGGGKSRKWAWRDGSPASYFHWHQKQPDNWSGKQACVSLTLPGYDGYWDDVQCSVKRDYICKTKCECHFQTLRISTEIENGIFFSVPFLPSEKYYYFMTKIWIRLFCTTFKRVPELCKPFLQRSANFMSKGAFFKKECKKVPFKSFFMMKFS